MPAVPFFLSWATTAEFIIFQYSVSHLMFICQSMSLFCFPHFLFLSPHFHYLFFFFLFRIYNIYILFFHSCLHHCFSFVCVRVCVSCSVMSDSLQSHELYPARLLCPWDFTGKNTRIIVMPFSRGSSPPRDQTWVSCIAGRLFTVWATREACVLALVLYLNIFNVHHQSFCSTLQSSICWMKIVFEETSHKANKKYNILCSL